MAELPKIISVDDHVVEPAHLWQTWLPARFRDRGPKVERRGIGTMRHIGGGTYEQTFDPDGPQADCWIYEDLVYINKRHDDVADHVRRDETRLLRTQSAHRRHGDELGRRVAFLSDLPAFLRSDVSRSKRPGARARMRTRVQRLDG